MNNTEKLKSPALERQDRGSILPLLLEPEQLTPERAELVNYLSEEVEIVEFELGDCSLNYPASHSDFVPHKQNSQYFFWVREGRLRLLGFDVHKRREVSTYLLTEGATFGGDSFWCKTCLSYRAIAASKVRVARISLAKLQAFLEKLPELQTKWQTEARERQKLIFFKTLTELRSISSHRLKQLLPYLEEKQITAGEPVARADEVGRFWLRRGQIKDQDIELGSSWGYPAEIPKAWLAQTNLSVYQLSQQNWQTFSELAPTLVSAWDRNSDCKSLVAPASINGKSGGVTAPSLPIIVSSPASHRDNPPQPNKVPQGDR